MIGGEPRGDDDRVNVGEGGSVVVEEVVEGEDGGDARPSGPGEDLEGERVASVGDEDIGPEPPASRLEEAEELGPLEWVGLGEAAERPAQDGERHSVDGGAETSGVGRVDAAGADGPGIATRRLERDAEGGDGVNRVGPPAGVNGRPAESLDGITPFRQRRGLRSMGDGRAVRVVEVEGPRANQDTSGRSHSLEIVHSKKVRQRVLLSRLSIISPPCELTLVAYLRRTEGKASHSGIDQT